MSKQRKQRVADAGELFALPDVRVMTEDEEARHRLREAEAEFMAEARRMISWGVPAKDVERVITGQLQRSLAMAAVAAQQDRSILVLSGRVGCGKTTAAGWWLRKGAPTHPRFVEARGRRFVAASWLERQKRYDDSFDELERYEMLVVDDLGMEYADGKGNFLANLDAVLDARYRNMLATLLTTNLSRDQFRERYGGGADGRLSDRIRECGTFVNVDAESLRAR